VVIGADRRHLHLRGGLNDRETIYMGGALLDIATGPGVDATTSKRSRFLSGSGEHLKPDGIRVEEQSMGRRGLGGPGQSKDKPTDRRVTNPSGPATALRSKIECQPTDRRLITGLLTRRMPHGKPGSRRHAAITPRQGHIGLF
jgi:hypothetical protein